MKPFLRNNWTNCNDTDQIKLTFAIAQPITTLWFDGQRKNADHDATDR